MTTKDLDGSASKKFLKTAGDSRKFNGVLRQLYFVGSRVACLRGPNWMHATSAVIATRTVREILNTAPNLGRDNKIVSIKPIMITGSQHRNGIRTDGADIAYCSIFVFNNSVRRVITVDPTSVQRSKTIKRIWQTKLLLNGWYEFHNLRRDFAIMNAEALDSQICDPTPSLHINHEPMIMQYLVFAARMLDWSSEASIVALIRCAHFDLRVNQETLSRLFK